MNTKLDRGLRVLIVANFLVVAALALAMVANWMQITVPWSATPSLAPSASPSQDVMQMGLAHIPTSNDCLLCHYGGGQGGVKPIPAMRHPLAGWTECLVCHTNEKLGRTAPGHQGIAQTECLNCHKEAPIGPAITQAHANLNKPCLDCHGSVAHLPTSMVGRDQTECWLCHKPNPQPPPLEPHPDNPNLTCRTCHQASDVGALPIDHALRSDATCVLCHQVGQASPSPSSPSPSSPASQASPSPSVPAGS